LTAHGEIVDPLAADRDELAVDRDEVAVGEH
jgi:hypothetical protein